MDRFVDAVRQADVGGAGCAGHHQPLPAGGAVLRRQPGHKGVRGRQHVRVRDPVQCQVGRRLQLHQLPPRGRRANARRRFVKGQALALRLAVDALDAGAGAA